MVVSTLLVAWIGVQAQAGSFRATCYPSGFKIAIEERPGVPLVGLGMMVSGGSSTEQEDSRGIAHFVEHLWFRRPQGEWPHTSDLLDHLGAQANAYTNVDETAYFTVAHKKHFRALLELESRRVQDPLAGLQAEVLAVERDVVLNEARQNYNGSIHLQTAVYSQTLTQGHPYRGGVIGPESSIEAFTLQQATAYVQEHYKPAQTSLYIAGDVTTEEARALIAEVFPSELLAHPDRPEDTAPGGCPGKAPVYGASQAVSPMEPSDELATVKANVDKPMAVLAWPARKGAKSAARVEAVAYLLDRHITSKNLDGFCTHWDHQDLNTVVCAVEVDEASQAEGTLASLQRQFDRMWANATETAFRKGRDLYYASRWRQYRLDSSTKSSGAQLTVGPRGHLAERAGMLHWLGYEPDHQPIDAATAAVIVRQELGPARRVVVVPEQDTSASAGSWHDARARAQVSSGGSGGSDEAVDFAEHVVNPLVGIERREVEGGHVLWVLRRPGIAYSRISVVYPGDGSFADPATTAAAWAWATDPWSAMSSSAAWKLIRQEGGTSLSRSPRAWRFDVYSGTFEATLAGLKASLPKLGQVDKKGDVKRMLKARLKRVPELLEEPSRQAELVRWKALADGLPHPYLEEGGPKAVMGASSDDAEAFVKEAFAPSRRSVVAVINGGTDPSEQLRLLSNTIDDVTPDLADTTWEAPIRSARAQSITVLADETRQASVALSCHVSSRDEVALDLVGDLVADALHNRLRNDLGVTYGVNSWVSHESHGPTLQIRTDLPPSLVGTGLSAILGQIESTSKGHVEGLDAVKLAWAKSTVMQWQTTRGMANLAEDLIVAGIDPREWSPADSLRKIDASHLANALAACGGREAVTVTGPAERIAESLAEAGLQATVR